MVSIMKPGDIQFLWQIHLDQGEHHWRTLPNVFSRAMDREYAKFATQKPEGPALRGIVSFAIHINFNKELSFKWIQAKTKLNNDGSRSALKPCLTALVANFNRRSLEVQLDGGPWQSVRCVKVTYEQEGEVVQACDLAQLLQHRLQEYQSDGEDSQAAREDQEMQEAEAAEAAEQEGIMVPVENMAEAVGDGRCEEEAGS